MGALENVGGMIERTSKEELLSYPSDSIRLLSGVGSLILFSFEAWLSSEEIERILCGRAALLE